MEFVTFVVGMSIIALANAAALKRSSSPFEFEVPEIASGGFEMTLIAPIHKQIQDELISQSLATKIEDGQGLHINIIIQAEKKNEMSNKIGELQSNTFNLRLKVTKRPQSDKLLLQVFLDDDFQNEAETTFENLRHISIGGLIEDVNHLSFDFTDEAIS